jgi:predicted permease
MRLLGRSWFTVRALLRRSALERETEEELQFHIEKQTEAHMAAGQSRQVATREALRLFGGLRRVVEECRDSSGAALFDSGMQDLRYAARGFSRAPLFLASVVLLVGLGIGLNAAMFEIVDQVILNGPAHVREPHGLRRIYTTTEDHWMGRHTQGAQPYAFYTAIAQHAQTVSGVAAYTGAALKMGRGLDSYTVPAVAVTSTFFPVLGVRPELGRFFTASEDDPSNPSPVVVLGDGFWRRTFGADSGIIGRVVHFGTRAMTVVGVAPPSFTGVERAPVDAWITVSAENAGSPPDWQDSWSWRSLSIVMRPRPGVTNAQVDAELLAMALHGYPNSGERVDGLEEHALPITYDNDGSPPKELAVSKLLAAVSLTVLIIALANVLNLLVARAMRRSREVAVRVALGAGRARLARLFLIEGGLLAAASAVVGVGIAWWTGALVRVWLFPGFEWPHAPVNSTLLLFVAASAVATAALLGMIPAARLGSANLAGSLKAGAPQSGAARSYTRTWLQIAQVALTVLLLVSAGAFVTSLQRVRHLDLGMQTDRVVAVDLGLPDLDTGRHVPDSVVRDHELLRTGAIVARLAAVPGVDAAAAAVGTPFHSSMGVPVTVPGRDSMPTGARGPFLSSITPGYFATTGMHLLRGRTFLASDVEGSPAVLIVNRTMANLLWPGQEPIGQCVQIGGPCATVVGVVADARMGRLIESPTMQYYVPMMQSMFGNAEFLVRARQGDPLQLVPSLRAALRSVVPNAQSARFRSWTEALDPQVRPWRIGSLLFGGFGLLALIVACFGLYSLASYSVAQRTHELGVRIALGASAGRVVRLVLGNGLVSVVVGAAVGITAALLLSPVLQPLLFDTSAHDPRLYAAVLAAILITSAMASFVPSWRATRVDPLTALRAD